MKRISLFFVLQFFIWFLPLSALPSDSTTVVLTQDQVTKIRSELNAMKMETALLLKQSENWKADSLMWKNKCTELEEKLNRALQMSEISEKSVIELQEQVQILRTLLDELKKEFSELNKSFQKQKKKITFWRTVSAVLGTAVLTEGLIICARDQGGEEEESAEEEEEPEPAPAPEPEPVKQEKKKKDNPLQHIAEMMQNQAKHAEEQARAASEKAKKTAEKMTSTAVETEDFFDDTN